MKYVIVERTFNDQGEALLFAVDHACIAPHGHGLPLRSQSPDGPPLDEWRVFELVPEGSE